MKIIYCGQSVNGIPRVVGLYYLGCLNAKKDLTVNNLEKYALFINKNNNKNGQFNYLGKDDKGNQIFTLGCQGQEEIIINMLIGIQRMFNLNDQAIIINTNSTNNIFINIGKKINKIGCNRVGRFLVKLGLKLNYQEILNLVTNTKGRIKN